MDRDALGDLPLGKYQVLNTVTKFERDRLLEWNVGSAERVRSATSTATNSIRSATTSPT